MARPFIVFAGMDGDLLGGSGGLPRGALATKSFGEVDQQIFAKLSGDRNPIHLDRVAARRTQAGFPVVHGMHLALWAVDEMAKADLLRGPISRVSVRFVAVVYVGDTVGITITRHNSSGLRGRLTVDGTTVATFTVSFGARATAIDSSHSAHIADRDRAWPERPVSLQLHELPTTAGSVRFAESTSAAADIFPAASHNLGEVATSGFVCLSRLVGMACPGLHSLFSSFDVEVVEAASVDDRIHYHVDSVDERFRLVSQRVSGGGLRGVVEAFARVPPVEQPPIAELARLVAAGEFSGRTALILGGSRGLGEVCAKLIAAGGGNTIITYAVGQEDAARVRDDIRAWPGAGSCEVMRYDVRQSAEAQLRLMDAAPDSFYYFATAPIFTRKTAAYSAAVYGELQRFYVDGFYEACLALRAKSAKPLSIFYPSSVAVVDRPAGITEYAMVKAAGEVLCADLARSMAGVHVTVSRLPRLLTDQTATVMPVDDDAQNAFPAAVMVPIVRAVEAAFVTAPQ